jgi:hypothetical protein
VALQGTLETFALADVLRLLASTKKSGQLRLSGALGSGSVWLDEGQIVGTSATAAPLADDDTEVLFELLRFETGSFVFDADEVAPDPGAPADVEETLTAAEGLLDEWKEIEAVVPSLDGWVSLAPELLTDDHTIDGTRWSQIVAVAGGITVRDLCEKLGQSELAGSRIVKDLIEVGLVSLGEAPVGSPVFVSLPPAAEVEGWLEPEPFESQSFDADQPDADQPEPFEPEAPESAPFELEALEVDADRVPVGGAVLTVVDTPSFDGDSFDPSALVIEPPGYGGGSSEPDSAVSAPLAAAPAQTDADDLTDAAEIARQLANLSPKAAKAVAAAAKATTQEEREAALAEVDNDEEPINRDLLLKFLGSVNG